MLEEKQDGTYSDQRRHRLERCRRLLCRNHSRGLVFGVSSRRSFGTCHYVVDMLEQAGKGWSCEVAYFLCHYFLDISMII